MVDSCDTWVINGPNEDLAPALYFANRGYDIWLGNNRGTYYSKEHIDF